MSEGERPDPVADGGRGSGTAAGHDGVVRVVAALDGSEPSLAAVRWAAREAQSRGVPLTVLHALHLPDAAVAPLEPDDLASRQEQAGAALLTSVKESLGSSYPDLKIETEISSRTPLHRLVEVSAPDTLVVTGTRGHGGFVGMLLGSVSRALAAHASGPLTVVRGADYAADGPVVLGVGPEAAECAIEFAFAAAQRYGTGLRAVRAWWPAAPLSEVPMPTGVGLGYAASGISGLPAGEPQETEENEAAWAEQSLARVRARYPDVQVEIRADAGNPVPVLCAAAEDASLLVVGAHRRHSLFSIGAGYVVEGLLSHCTTPVAVVPVAEVSAAEGDDAGDAGGGGKGEGSA